MKKNLLILILFFSLGANAQNEQLANNYFDRGDFEKALLSYEDLLKNQIGNFNYFQHFIHLYLLEYCLSKRINGLIRQRFLLWPQG